MKVVKIKQSQILIKENLLTSLLASSTWGTICGRHRANIKTMFSGLESEILETCSRMEP